MNYLDLINSQIIHLKAKIIFLILVLIQKRKEEKLKVKIIGIYSYIQIMIKIYMINTIDIIIKKKIQLTEK